MSQENVEIIRRAYVALNERDLDSLAKLNHPDAILDFSRLRPFPAARHG